MKCASALSTATETGAAVREVVDRVAGRLGGEAADMALAFASPHHASGLGQLADDALAQGLARHVLACTGEAIVGDGREVEGSPALSLWAATLPRGVAVRPVRLTYDGDAFEGWPDGGATPGGRTLLLLADPFSFPADRWLAARAEHEPGLRIVGGIASGGFQPGVNRLVLDSDVYREGAVGLILEGPLPLRTVVSQGCRPIGRPMIVTRAQGNVVKELGRRPALEVFRELFASLDEDEQRLVQQGLHLGRVIDEYRESFGRGDFLVRNVMGADDEGGLAITDSVRVGQTVQFHVRDASTADDDLRTLLAAGRGDEVLCGALLFTCNGRGTRLFPGPDHDAAAIRDCCGAIPVAGFFAMGEIGPVGGQNFLHGFTASVALFAQEAAGAGAGR